MKISLHINDKHIECDVEPRTLLVNFIRRDMRLTGTHVGCDTTQCGACTILLNGRATKSCTVLAVQANGATVRTVESVAKGEELHLVQSAFHEHHGLQCGFCTPGMIMASIDLLTRIPNPTEQDVRHNLEGNLCRCTGYQNIVTAVIAAGEELRARGAAAQDES